MIMGLEVLVGVSMVLVLAGTYLWILSAKGEVLKDVPFCTGQFQTVLPKGEFSIYVVGGYASFTSKGFELSINNVGTGQNISAHTPIMRGSARIMGKIANELIRFKISHSGEYDVAIAGLNSLTVRKSRLISRRLIEKPISQAQLRIVIRKSFSFKVLLYAAALTLLGVGLLLWSILKLKS